MKELFNKTRNNIMPVQSESKCSSMIQADSAKPFCIHDPFSLYKKFKILGSNKAFLRDKNISEGICCSKRGWISYFVENNRNIKRKAVENSNFMKAKAE